MCVSVHGDIFLPLHIFTVIVAMQNRIVQRKTAKKHITPLHQAFKNTRGKMYTGIINRR